MFVVYHRGEMMDKVLYEWFSLKRSEGVTITGPMLQEKGLNYKRKVLKRMLVQ